MDTDVAVRLDPHLLAPHRLGDRAGILDTAFAERDLLDHHRPLADDHLLLDDRDAQHLTGLHVAEAVQQLLDERVRGCTGNGVQRLAVDRVVLDDQLLAADGDLDGALLGDDLAADRHLAGLDRLGVRLEVFLDQFDLGTLIGTDPLLAARPRSGLWVPGGAGLRRGHRLGPGELACAVGAQDALDFGHVRLVLAGIDDHRAVRAALDGKPRLARCLGGQVGGVGVGKRADDGPTLFT